MKIATGHPVTADEIVHDFKAVRFLTDDGRPMFEVSIGSDGRSIEVRGVDTYKFDGVIYTEALEIRPRYANSVEVRTLPYDTSNAEVTGRASAACEGPR